MQIQTQITWPGMPPSPAVGAKIHEEAAKLEEFYDRITRCRVTIEIPHRYQNGKYQFHIRIDLTVPGDRNRGEPRTHLTQLPSKDGE